MLGLFNVQVPMLQLTQNSIFPRKNQGVVKETTVNKEKAIRAIVSSFVEAYAAAFSDRHLSEVDDEDGTINMKIHNVFIAALGPEIQYYSALARSLDSSLGNMLEKMAIKIATLNYEVTQEVEGVIYQEQTDYIAELLECYKNTKGANHKKPSVEDYRNIIAKNKSDSHNKVHVSDYYLRDTETGMHSATGTGDWHLRLRILNRPSCLFARLCRLH